MTDPNQIRINELARELEVKAKAILDYLPELGLEEKKTHSSSLDLAVAEKVRKHFKDAADEEAAAETAAVAAKAAKDAAARAARMRPAAATAPAPAASAPPAQSASPPAAPAARPVAPAAPAGATPAIPHPVGAPVIAPPSERQPHGPPCRPAPTPISTQLSATRPRGSWCAVGRAARRARSWRCSKCSAPRRCGGKTCWRTCADWPRAWHAFASSGSSVAGPAAERPAAWCADWNASRGGWPTGDTTSAHAASWPGNPAPARPGAAPWASWRSQPISAASRRARQAADARQTRTAPHGCGQEWRRPQAKLNQANRFMNASPPPAPVRRWIAGLKRANANSTRCERVPASASGARFARKLPPRLNARLAK